MTEPGGGPAAPGWYPDPQGRFVHRYFDGSGWTDQIDDGRGWHGPESGWPTQLRPGPGPGAGGGGGGGAGGGGDGPSTAGVTVVLLGALTMMLGLFSLPWLSDEGETASLEDIRVLVDRYVEDAPGIVGPYFGVGAFFAAFGVPIVALAAVFARGPLRRALMVITGVAGGLAVVCHLLACRDLVDGHVEEYSAGPWVAGAGMVITVVGALLPRPRAPRLDPIGPR
ncbi:hypothetical protein CcI49_05355 [Frankia sp. CcI49]|uniref:DUF2510 domain-containing protein n=1 Tax=Frankia sp. CcI49 TaxID=1745382 RepID=UPI0009D56DDE|nr:DUF2510 domain-containing protein [Frankia sp. CcI49]ONH61633.1 hypothetical protein CcI49_05355 [Frankia sp. CcI49]